MDYKLKYLKYKKKYLNLKGGEHNFDIYTIDETDELYHGTFNKLMGNLIAPSFFSKDMLQSLGHILSGLHYQAKNLSNKTSCFPTIFNFKAKRKINLLKINKPYSYTDSFDLLFVPHILWKYLLIINDPVDIFYNFLKKLQKIYTSLKIPESKSLITIENMCEVFNYNMNGYKHGCKRSCFMGWANIPGYYLLSCIDYNKYFQEIGVTTQDIDGIYVEQDQDEIILFDPSLLELHDTYYIFPYTYKFKSIEDNKNFMKKYINFSTEYKKYKFHNPSFLKLLDEYTFIDGIEKWGFNWYKTECDHYDPLKEIFDDSKPETEKGCAEYIQCKKRYASFVNSYDKNCDVTFKSSKISILNLKNVKLLHDYMCCIKNWKKSLFEDVAVLCENPNLNDFERILH